MNARALLIGAVLLVLPGCYTHTVPLAYPNASISDAKQGQDCSAHIFGLGGHAPDLTIAQAIRLGGITRLRSAEYQSNSTVQGIENECVVAHGE
jgi:hypothetical protein